MEVETLGDRAEPRLEGPYALRPRLSRGHAGPCGAASTAGSLTSRRWSPRAGRTSRSHGSSLALMRARPVNGLEPPHWGSTNPAGGGCNARLRRDGWADFSRPARVNGRLFANSGMGHRLRRYDHAQRRRERRSRGRGRTGVSEPVRCAQRRRRRRAHRRPQVAGVRRAARCGGRTSADRRIEPRPADPDPGARRLCRACRLRSCQRDRR